jgi:hypothetical protein
VKVPREELVACHLACCPLENPRISYFHKSTVCLSEIGVTVKATAKKHKRDLHL